MPIQIGSGENQENILLGSVQVQEVRLGTILKWVNNRGPYIGTITVSAAGGIDTNSFDSDDEGEIDGIDTVFVGPYSGTQLNYTINFSDLTDEDYTQQAAEGVPLAERDTIVGYRVLRPDGTWLFGDPDDTDPEIAEFGVLFGAATYDPITMEVSGGAIPSAVDLDITVPFRRIDSGGTNVNSASVPFTDEGEWQFFAVDRRGGETAMAIIDFTLVYQSPNVVVNGSGTNFACGTGSTTLSFTNTGGPINSITWDGSVTTETYNVTVPTFVSGSNAHTLSVSGPISQNNVSLTDSETVFVRERAPYSAAGTPSASTGLGGFSGLTASSGVTVAGCAGVPVPANSYSFSYGGSRSGSGSGTSASWSTLTCPAGSASPESVTLTVSASNPSGSSSRSYSLSASLPSFTASCAVSSSACTNASLTTTTVTQGIEADNCDGGFGSGSFAASATFTAAAGFSFSGSNTTAISTTCNYPSGSGVSVTGTAITLTCPTPTATPGAATVNCPASSNVGSTFTCSVVSTVAGVAVTSPTTVTGTCSSLGGATSSATGTITYDNGTTSGSLTGTTNCITPPATLTGAGYNITAVGLGGGMNIINVTLSGNFSNPLSDDGSVFAFRSILRFSANFNCTDGTSGSINDRTIPANAAGCSPTCNGLSLTSVSDGTTTSLTATPASGAVCTVNWTANPGTYNSIESGNVSGSISGTETFTQP